MKSFFYLIVPLRARSRDLRSGLFRICIELFFKVDYSDSALSCSLKLTIPTQFCIEMVFKVDYSVSVLS